MLKWCGWSGRKDEKEPLLAAADTNAEKKGEKKIGFIGGVSLILNNITGPAMVTMPLLFQSAGWVTPSLCLFSMCIFSTLASTLMCEAIATIPGNANFEGRVEFCTLMSFFFGKTGHKIAQLFINVSLQCANIASIIECAQVADTAIIKIFGKTCALQLYPSVGWECVSTQTISDSPFSSSAYYLFTLGFLFMVVIVIPMGLLDLDDNIFIQILADIFLLIVSTDFIVTFVLKGLDFSSVPAFNSSGQSSVLGVIMANYVFVTTIPSWITEKKRGVSVNKSIWSATITSTAVFFLLGYFGAISFTFPPDGDILSVINASAYTNMFTKILVYLFPIMILATTIPVFSIIVRYNLLQSKIHKGLANLLAVVLPWVVVIPFLTGQGLNEILNWGTLLFASIANLVLPFAIYIRSCSFKKDPVMNDHQREILRDLKLVVVHGSINFDPEKPFVALPEGFPINPRYAALFVSAVLSILVVAMIGLNIYSLA